MNMFHMKQISHQKEKDTHLNSPITHSNIPTMSASNIASSVYSSSDELTIPPKTLETKRETNATGPTAS